MFIERPTPLLNPLKPPQLKTKRSY